MNETCEFTRDLLSRIIESEHVRILFVVDSFSNFTPHIFVVALIHIQLYDNARQLISFIYETNLK